MAVSLEAYRPEAVQATKFEHRGVPYELFERRDGVLEFATRVDGKQYQVDFYNIRDDSHKAEIVRRIASMESFTAHGHGINGFAQGIPINDRDSDYFADRFYDRKPGRKGKIPMLGTPKLILEIGDRDAVHHDLRHKLTREGLEEMLSVSGTRHFIVPLKEDSGRIHRNLKTYGKSASEDWKKSGLPQDHWLDRTTVSVVCLPDRDWDEVADEVNRRNPWVYIGITSMNSSGMEPAYDTQEGIRYFIDYAMERGEAPYDFGIRDSVIEPMNVRSSHAQNRFAYVGEEPYLYEHRGGHVRPEELSQILNLPVKQLEGAVRASTDYRGGMNHGVLLLEAITAANEDYRQRHIKHTETKFGHFVSTLSHFGKHPTGEAV